MRRLAARELDGHLATRLDVDRIVHDFHDFFPGQLVNIADLIGVHEAGIAHHVAAVGQVNRQDGAAAVLDGAAAVIVQTFIVMCRDVAAGEVLLDPFEELHVDSHQVFEVAMLRTVFDHPDLAIAFDNLRL